MSYARHHPIAGPVLSLKIYPLPDYNPGVDSGAPTIYPGVDTELYPRGRLRWLPESTPPSRDLPPLIVIM